MCPCWSALSLSLCSLSQSVPTLCSSPKSLTTIAQVRRTSPPPQIAIALCLMDSSFLEDPHPISPHLRPTSHATASATTAAAASSQKETVSSELLKPEHTDYAAMMSVIYSMVKLDYIIKGSFLHLISNRHQEN
ncbi:unnamed protein product [Camellia sinensis]